MHSIADGSLLASIDLPAYLSFVAAEGDSSVLPSSFCLLQVSSDLSTAVAVSHSNTAVALDLNHYFRYRETLSLVFLLQSSFIGKVTKVLSASAAADGAAVVNRISAVGFHTMATHVVLDRDRSLADWTTIVF